MLSTMHTIGYICVFVVINRKHLQHSVTVLIIWNLDKRVSNSWMPVNKGSSNCSRHRHYDCDMKRELSEESNLSLDCICHSMTHLCRHSLYNAAKNQSNSSVTYTHTQISWMLFIICFILSARRHVLGLLLTTQKRKFIKQTTANYTTLTTAWPPVKLTT